MMGVRAERPMPRHRACAVSSALLLIATGPAMAAPYVPYPSQDTLRQVQLAALACARENTAASCQRSLALADPLLDHPRLPSACKDQLWSIRERSRPAAVNSLERRDGLAKPAEDLSRLCRNTEVIPAEPPKPQAAGGGFKLGR